MVSLVLGTSDGQIQIMIWFKSWLNHIWWFDLNTSRFDLEGYHSIRIWFEFIMIWFVIWPNHKYTVECGVLWPLLIAICLSEEQTVFQELIDTKVVCILYNFQTF